TPARPRKFMVMRSSTGHRLLPAGGPIAAGILALAAIGLVILGAFAGLIAEAWGDWSGALAAFDPYMLRVARFTLWQALLSTLLSVGPAILVARALSRHPDLPGRGLILRLFILPLAIPSLV